MTVVDVDEKSNSVRKTVTPKNVTSTHTSSSTTKNNNVSSGSTISSASSSKSKIRTKRTTFATECRGPSDQNVLTKQSSGRQQSEDKDSLDDYLSNMEKRNKSVTKKKGTKKVTKNHSSDSMSTNALRERVHDIMRVRTPENSLVKNEFISDLLKNDSQDESQTVDGDLSISSTTVDGNISLFSDNASVLSDGYSQRSTMIDSILANMRSRRESSDGSLLSNGSLNVMQDLEQNGVLFVQTSTGATISISHTTSITREEASEAIASKHFNTWIQTTTKTYGAKRFSIMKLKILEVEKNELGNVGTIKLQVEGKLRDEEARMSWRNIKEICYLRQETIGLLVSLICIEDGSRWSLLVERPSLAIGRPSALELPSITYDTVSSKHMGSVIRAMKDLFDIDVDEHEFVNLTEESYNENRGLANVMGMTPNPMESSESFKFLSLSKEVTKMKLKQIRKNVSDAREKGSENAMFWVIPTDDIWKVSTDMKVMCALFLLTQRSPPAVQSRPFTTGSIINQSNGKAKNNTTGSAKGNQTSGVYSSESGIKDKMVAFFSNARRSWEF